MDTSSVPLAKICTKCHQSYPETKVHFQPQKGCRNGLRPTCRECDRRKQADYYAQNAERLAAYARDRRKNEPDKVHAEQKAGRKRNHDKILERNRKYRVAKPDTMRALERRYNLSPKGKARTHRRSARARSLPADFTSVDWSFALEYWNNCCAICGRQVGLWHKIVADHWIPLASGGGTVRSNILPMCHGEGGCNNSKQHFAPEAWLTKRLGKVQAAKKLREIQTFFQLTGVNDGQCPPRDRP